MTEATLIFLLKENPVAEVLLGYKKVGFGQGKYTGFGGKVEPGEGIVEATLRELTEETGVTVPDPENLESTAILEFRFPHKPPWNQDVHVSRARRWIGIPTESNEMRPQWFPVAALPYDQMWDDARYWLPRALSSEKFKVRFWFEEDNATVGRVVFGQP